MKSRERDPLGIGFYDLKLLTMDARTVFKYSVCSLASQFFVPELDFLAGTEIKCPISAPKFSIKINTDNSDRSNFNNFNLCRDKMNF